MIVDKIQQYLTQKEKTLDEALRYEVEKIAGWTFKRQFMTEENGVSKGTIRLSAAGKCPRQNAYKFHGIETKGKEIDSRAKVVFWMGDMVELTITQLAKVAGCTLIATGLNQITVDFPVNDIVVHGHPDGIVVHEGKMLLLEVKSMSSFSYDRTDKGEIDEGYLTQMNCYMSALNLDRCLLVYLNKDSGVMNERIIERDQSIIDEARENLKTVITSTPEKLPKWPDWCKPDAKGFLTWKCLYCPAWETCLGERVEKVLVGKAYKLKVKKEKKDA